MWSVSQGSQISGITHSFRVFSQCHCHHCLIVLNVIIVIIVIIVFLLVMSCLLSKCISFQLSLSWRWRRRWRWRKLSSEVKIVCGNVFKGVLESVSERQGHLLSCMGTAMKSGDQQSCTFSQTDLRLLLAWAPYLLLSSSSLSHSRPTSYSWELSESILRFITIT